MKSSSECERVRVALMASVDGEAAASSADDEQHVSACASCGQWLEELQRVVGQLQGLSYPPVQRDLWTTVAEQIGQEPERWDLARRLWPIGGIALGWRAIQLLVDVPLPLVHPLVPLAAVAAAVWFVTGDALAIRTSAPELQKRGA